MRIFIQAPEPLGRRGRLRRPSAASSGRPATSIGWIDGVGLAASAGDARTPAPRHTPASTNMVRASPFRARSPAVRCAPASGAERPGRGAIDAPAAIQADDGRVLVDQRRAVARLRAGTDQIQISRGVACHAASCLGDKPPDGALTHARRFSGSDSRPRSLRCAAALVERARTIDLAVPCLPSSPGCNPDRTARCAPATS